VKVLKELEPLQKLIELNDDESDPEFTTLLRGDFNKRGVFPSQNDPRTEREGGTISSLIRAWGVSTHNFPFPSEILWGNRKKSKSEKGEETKQYNESLPEHTATTKQVQTPQAETAHARSREAQKHGFEHYTQVPQKK
jgi:hypothetical protein